MPPAPASPPARSDVPLALWPCAQPDATQPTTLLPGAARPPRQADRDRVHPARRAAGRPRLPVAPAPGRPAGPSRRRAVPRSCHRPPGQHGAGRDRAARTVRAAEQAGLAYLQHVIALLAPVQAGQLKPTLTGWQRRTLRARLARGEHAQHPVHADVLVFATPEAADA